MFRWQVLLQKQVFIGSAVENLLDYSRKLNTTLRYTRHYRADYKNQHKHQH